MARWQRRFTSPFTQCSDCLELGPGSRLCSNFNGKRLRRLPLLYSARTRLPFGISSHDFGVVAISKTGST